MRLSDHLRLLTLAAIWGASFLFMKIVAPVLGAFTTAFFRVFFGVIGLSIILMLMRIQWDFKGKFKYALALGVINSGIPFAMYCIAARFLPAGYSAILNATTPLMGIVIGALFFDEKVTGKKTTGVVLGLTGVFALTTIGPVNFSRPVVAGALACLVATSCYGVAGFLAKRWISERGGLDAKLIAFGSQIGAIILLAPFFGGSIATSPQPPAWGGTEVWLALAALGLICTASAYILYFRLIADIGPVRSSTVTFLIPPFGVLWGALFLNETVTWAHLLGGSLIAVAVWLVLSQPKPSRNSMRGSA